MGPLTGGAALALALIRDGLAVAWWSDTRGRPDMPGWLIVWGAPLCAGGFVGIFLSADQTHLLSIAAIMLCRFGYTLCDVGHNTLLVRVSVDERDASIVSGMRLRTLSLNIDDSFYFLVLPARSMALKRDLRRSSIPQKNENLVARGYA